MKIKLSNHSPIQSFALLSIPLSCVLLQYKAAMSTYGLILLTLVALMLSIGAKFFSADMDFVKMLAVFAVQQLVAYILFKSNFTAIINILLTMFLTGVIVSVFSEGYIERESLYRYLKAFSIIVTAVIYLQAVMIVVFQRTVSPIMLLPQSAADAANWSRNAYRPSGFFSEPQTYCSMILPICVLAAYKKDFKLLVYLSLGILLAGSSLGIIMVALLWATILFTSSTNKNTKIGIVALILLGIVIFLTVPALKVPREKLYSVFSGFFAYSSGQMVDQYSYSSYLRLVKGWITYFEEPFLPQIVGVGFNNFANFMRNSGLTFSWNQIWSSSASSVAYFSSASGIFLEGGIFSAAAYIIYMVKNWKRSNSLGKTLLLMIILQSFATQMFFNSLFIFNILIFYIYGDKKFKRINFIVQH